MSQKTKTTQAKKKPAQAWKIDSFFLISAVLFSSLFLFTKALTEDKELEESKSKTRSKAKSKSKSKPKPRAKAKTSPKRPNNVSLNKD